MADTAEKSLIGVAGRRLHVARWHVGEAEHRPLLMLNGIGMNLELLAPLARALPGRIGWELRLIVLGGLRIIEAIETANYDVFRHRPVLGKHDWLRLGWRALNYRKIA